jgi:tRNA(Arg) A34 adenosine deaminase TadA
VVKVKAICFDKKGNIISRAENSYDKTHPLQKHFAMKVNEPHRIYLHAEMLALIRAKNKRISSIHIARQAANGKNALAKPCKICMAAIKAYGVKFISYTTNNGITQKELS